MTMPRLAAPAIGLLSVGVAAYALAAYLFFPLGAAVHPEMRESFEAHRLAVYVHVFGSAVALLVGPLQFRTGLRSRRPRVHRWLGRFYLGAGVTLGGLAGLFLAAHAYGGILSRLGFACLALAWLHTGARAYAAARSHDFAAHRRWMVRNFALAFAAVTLRLWLPGLVGLGVPFDLAYPVVAWLCWLPNMLVAERLLRNDARPLVRADALGESGRSTRR